MCVMKVKCELVLENHEFEEPKFPVIDMHTHFGSLLFGDNYEETYDTRQVVAAMKKAGVRKAVVHELVWHSEYDRLIKKLEAEMDFFAVFGSVDVSKALEKNFDQLVLKQIRYLKSHACAGIKLWKNITLFGEDYFGKNLRLDDPRFDVIFKVCGEEKMPILIHVADPPCFFRKLDETNEHYACLSAHPEWSFDKPGIASFEEHMEMQENVIRNNPDTTFVVAHVGSYAENLKKVGEWLDLYPNMYVDIAARVDQLGRQPYTAKAFIEKYQDRILFGTDLEATFSEERIAEFYHTHYRFLQTKDEYFDHPFPDFLGQWKVFGLGLDDDVLEKLYFKNTEDILKIGLD